MTKSDELHHNFIPMNQLRHDQIRLAGHAIIDILQRFDLTVAENYLVLEGVFESFKEMHGIVYGKVITTDPQSKQS